MKLLLKTFHVKNWKTSVICCVSFLCAFFANVACDLACGGEIDPYDYYVSFFHNDLQDPNYKSFAFTGYSFLYDENEPVSEADINSAEWAAYLGSDVKPADVTKVMYHLNEASDSVLLTGYFKQADSLPDTLKSNTFIKAVADNKTALKYYKFAKTAEKLANTSYDPWDPKPIDTLTLRREGMNALAYAEAEKDKFIQLRYYYQAQRLLHYSFSYAMANNIYDHYIAKSLIQSHIKGWALALKAGEERRLGDTVEAAYHFSKVFAQYPERRVQAYKNFYYLGINTAKILPLAANNAEKAVLYAIDGFGNPGLNMEPLQKVYQFDPASPMVGTLLIREINKLEEDCLTPQLSKARPAFAPDVNYQSVTDDNQAKHQAAFDKLKAFCKQLIADQKYPEPAIANLALAYLAWMQGHTDEGLTWLKTLYDVKLNAKLTDQKQIIQILITAQQIKHYDKLNEATLLSSLKWLDGKVKDEMQGSNRTLDDTYFGKHPFAATTRNFYQQILAPAYLKQGDTTKAALALLKADITARDQSQVFNADVGFESANFYQNYLHSADLEKVIGWKQSPPADQYLAFLTSGLKVVDLNCLDELLGTLYLREHQYKLAASCLKKVTPALLNKFPTNYYNDVQIQSDPFIERINDYPKVLTYGHIRGYNKLQFATAMNTVLQQLKDDPANVASYYYKMATALYNTSTYGNAWYLISYSWSSMDFGRPKIYNYDDDYIKATNAEKYFLLALKLGKSSEFKAKCTFMAAKCRQKQVSTIASNLNLTDAQQDVYQASIQDNPYFETLKNSYRRTAFYKKAVGECSYLKDFIAAK